MLSKQIAEKAVGKMGCETCDGKGMYNFLGSRIFCERCHGEDGVAQLWKNVDAMVPNNKIIPNRRRA